MFFLPADAAYRQKCDKPTTQSSECSRSSQHLLPTAPSQTQHYARTRDDLCRSTDTWEHNESAEEVRLIQTGSSGLTDSSIDAGQRAKVPVQFWLLNKLQYRATLPYSYFDDSLETQRREVYVFCGNKVGSGTKEGLLGTILVRVQAGPVSHTSG
jgi:hypothetical protein